jgi:subfamily B ATP-binding cassette protein MsbA
MAIFLRLLKYVKRYWRNLTISIICTVFFSLFSGVSIYLSIPLLQVLFNQGAPAASHPQVGPPPSESHSWVSEIVNQVSTSFQNLVFSGSQSEALFRICAIVLVAFLLKNFFDYLRAYTLAFVEQGVIRDLRDDLYRHIHRLSLGYFTNERTGNLISRVTNDVTVLQGSVATSFLNLIREPLLIIVFVGIAAYISWQLTLLAVIVFPFSLFVISRIGIKLHKESGVVQEKIADITSVLQETISGVKVVKAFGMEEFENKKFGRETQDYFRQVLKLTRIRNLASPTTEFLSIAAGVVIIWFGGRQVLGGGGLSPAEFIGFLLVIFQAMPPIKELTSVVNRFQESSAAGERVFEILDTQPKVKNAANAVAVREFKDSIEFRRVSFTYEAFPPLEETNSGPVLKNLNLCVRKGEVLAIVGPSGGGKTTLVDLLPRFYDPTDGQILFDGIDLREIEIKSLRDQIGIVTQETILFNDTIRSNIAYGLGDFPTKNIVEAAKAANAHEFIEEMPLGYDTVVGERGMKLSGGQRQRISIARALLKNPPIMIFDEATSSLDSESEILVQDAIERLMKNRTTFVIAHRLSTIRNAHRIIVIDDGQIIQEGTHSDLIGDQHGLYRKLYDMQFNM